MIAPKAVMFTMSLRLDRYAVMTQGQPDQAYLEAVRQVMVAMGIEIAERIAEPVGGKR